MRDFFLRPTLFCVSVHEFVYTQRFKANESGYSTVHRHEHTTVNVARRFVGKTRASADEAATNL